MTADNIVLLVTRLSIADWVYSKTQILLATLRTQIQPLEGSYVFLEAKHFPVVGCACVFLEVEPLFQPVGCARNKLLSRTVLQSLEPFLCMLDCVWMGYLLSIFGT